MGFMRKMALVIAGFAGVLSGVPRMASGGPIFECPPEGTDLTWETFASPFFETYCTGPCHVHSWEEEYVVTYARRETILQFVTNGTMPLDPALPPPQAEIDKLEEWIGCGAPMECPSGGTSLTWETFAVPFFETKCSGCHSWDESYSTTYEYREEMYRRVLEGSMPAFSPPLPVEELAMFAEWITCDLPLTGDSCIYGYTGFAETVFADNCTQCHSVNLSGAARQGAPEGMDWDDYASVLANASAIRDVLLAPPFPEMRTAPHETAVPLPELDHMIAWLACGAPEESLGDPYKRGDANDDGQQDLSDAVFILAFVFTGGSPALCLDAADSNQDGFIDLADGVYLLSYIFQNTVAPPAPFLSCDKVLVLGCETYLSCD